MARDPRAPATTFPAYAAELRARARAAVQAEGKEGAARARLAGHPALRRAPAWGGAVGTHARAHALGLARPLPLARAPARLCGQPGAGRARAQVAAPLAQGAVGGADTAAARCAAAAGA